MKKSIVAQIPYYNVLNAQTRQMIDMGEFLSQTGLSNRLNLTFGDTLQDKITMIQGMVMLVDAYISFETLVASHDSDWDINNTDRETANLLNYKKLKKI